MKCPNCGYELWPNLLPNKDRDDKIKQLYHEDKWEPEQLSERYRVCVGRIKQIIGYKNLRPDVKKDARLKRRLAIYADRESGMTFKAVGQKHGIGAQRARDIWFMEKRRAEYRKRREEITP